MRLVITGDYHTYGAFEEHSKEYPDHGWFGAKLKRLVSDSDIAVFNLEDPLCRARDNKIVKAGPCGVGDPESLKWVVDAGFKVATFATNHTRDLGSNGVSETIENCQKYGVAVLGAGINEEMAACPFLFDKDGCSIAILNFTRDEYNLAEKDKAGANALVYPNVWKSIVSIRDKVDKVIVIAHEGVDTFNLPSPGMMEMAHFMVDVGADFVVFHHARRVSGREIYKGKLIEYGLGNLIHNSANEMEHDGIVLQIDIMKNHISSKEIFIRFDSERKVVEVADDSLSSHLREEMNGVSRIIQHQDLYESAWKEYVEKTLPFNVALAMNVPRTMIRVLRKFRMLGLAVRFAIWSKFAVKMLPLFTCGVRRELIISSLQEVVKAIEEKK